MPCQMILNTCAVLAILFGQHRPCGSEIVTDRYKLVVVLSQYVFVHLQAILMSMCLQGMVDEVIMEKQGRKIRRVKNYHIHVMFHTHIKCGGCMFFPSVPLFSLFIFLLFGLSSYIVHMCAL